MSKNRLPRAKLLREELSQPTEAAGFLLAICSRAQAMPSPLNDQEAINKAMAMICATERMRKMLAANSFQPDERARWSCKSSHFRTALVCDPFLGLGCFLCTAFSSNSHEIAVHSDKSGILCFGSWISEESK